MATPPEKSDGAFRTIREVADWLGVPTHVLRFWESKFEQIAPVKGAGGRRYYRPEDMRLLGGIKVMLHDQGLTIRAVSQRIESEGVAPIMDLSPELDMPEGPPARTRRVIRYGESGEAPATTSTGSSARDSDPARAKPAIRASEPAAEQGAEDAADTSRPDIRPDPATPVEDLLPDQPDVPTEGSTAQPAPDSPPAEAPAPQPTPAGPDDIAPDEDVPLPEAPTDEPRVTDAAPAPSPDRVDDAGDPVSETPEDDDAPLSEDVSDDDEADPAIEPDSPDAAHPVPVHPTRAALELARRAGDISPTDKMRLRRVVRRYRALIEEITEDMADRDAS
ncbi:MerR family transcriptional regulator [Jannaschia sp. 2305UL9-9]|uniref:MerR family transcriptional regulator n=1 Tax=Jannaschia sp. 2305UL9-9 TaxID=3121638 RepID=UPI0035291193